MAREITKWGLAASLVLIVGWDIFLVVTPPKNDTISALLLEWAWDWPTIPMAWGIITGHLFWPTSNISHKWIRIAFLWGICVLTFVADILWLEDIMPLVPTAAGVLLGRALWPQKDT